MLGTADLCMWPPPDLEERVTRLVRQAVEAGVTLIDTADAYCPDEGSFGLGETVVERAVASLPPPLRPAVMTKGGHTRFNGTEWGFDGSAEYLRRACRRSAERLRRRPLDLYALHRPDPAAPFRESVRGLLQCVEEGLTREVVLSNVDAERIALAHDVLGPSLAGVQNEFSLLRPDGRREIRLCERLGLTYFAWAPLGGARGVAGLARSAPLAAVARAHGCTPEEAALAWVLAAGPAVVPVVGTSRSRTLRSCVHALDIRLTDAEVAALG
ncbi:aldo/keto reductase [Actinoallomurus oryzae]|uniref:Aldo/keto reductase n=1 Tax=Actinoallomurus oryzae TaxID=502180 RepID=A0ABP8P862_9ACTN